MDFPTIALILVGAISVGTVMAAGGIKGLIPPKAPVPGRKRPAHRLSKMVEPAGPSPADGEFAGDGQADQRGGRVKSGRDGAKAPSEPEAKEDPADNFFSDGDDFVFREPDANRGPFSQREEDRDSMEDPDRNR